MELKLIGFVLLICVAVKANVINGPDYDEDDECKMFFFDNNRFELFSFNAIFFHIEFLLLCSGIWS